MWMFRSTLFFTLIACSGGSNDGGTDDSSPTSAGATCASLCEQIEGTCGADEKCVEECERDEENAASCGEEADWSALLDCCDGGDFSSYCADEDGFDPCQKGVCEDMRPPGATAGCD